MNGCRINGLTHINLTKLDVLSELETIRLGVGYKVDGKSISSVPSEIATLEKVEMVYEDVPGWQSDISKVRIFLSHIGQTNQDHEGLQDRKRSLPEGRFLKGSLRVMQRCTCCKNRRNDGDARFGEHF